MWYTLCRQYESDLEANIITPFWSRIHVRVYVALKVDNKGYHLIATEDSAINTPAVAAGHVIKRYTGQARDELTFEVGVEQKLSAESVILCILCLVADLIVDL